MDKYTVDLDKVLNDFEYSELTDQSNGYASNSAQNYGAPPPYTSYPKLQASTPKHSINNVFHSLNEYLNSDIKSDLAAADIQEIEANIPTLIRKNSREKAEIASIEQIFATISKDEDTLQISENLNSSSDKMNDATPMNNCVELSFVNDCSVKNTNHLDQIDNSIYNTRKHENLSVKSNKFGENSIVNDLTVKNNNNEMNLNNYNNDTIENQIERKSPDINSEAEDCVVVEDESTPEVKCVDSDVLVQKLSDESEKVLVGFDDLNISDTEMENELAELEELDNNNEQLVETDDELQQKDLKSELEEIESNTVISGMFKTEIVDNELDVRVESPAEKCIESPTEIVAPIVIEAHELVEKKEEQLETVCQEVEVVVVDETAERRNSLCRPNSLDLNSEPSSENLTINLIGDPGSTPYNNMYLESSLKPADQLENDANQSLSPTFSETSAYENSESPNTSDSCNDTSFEDYVTGAAPKNSNKEPLRRLNNETTENETAENADNDGVTPTANNQGSWLGKTAPFWTPDGDALSCLHCDKKFTVFNRRHHCRACGLVLCTKCCHLKHKLEYMDNNEARICLKCYEIFTKDSGTTTTSSGSDASPESPTASPQDQASRLNPNNPMDYCSTVPPHQQVANVSNQPPTVMVPVGVLKRKGSGKSRSAKSVMFCDGIRPGCDLTELDYDFNYKEKQNNSSGSSSSKKAPVQNAAITRSNRNLPKIDSKTSSYIPADDASLPPIVNVLKSDHFYVDCSNNNSVLEMLRNETLTFALQRNLHIQVRLINMDCCINKQAWCFSTAGMISVGQDELVILLEFIDNEKTVPKDVFLHLNQIYLDAVKGTSITELGLSLHSSSMFLESKNHAGFLYIKPTFQCIQNLILPKEPYLIGVLIHRWETPWAKIFPLRLLLRLGAEYRYYPSPIISSRHRESVYVEIGHTIINLLADFRNFSYTIPSVRGLTIHMEDKNTTVSIPINRYDQVMKGLNNSSDHILAFAANFSSRADSHLVCIQDTHGNNENAYTTHAINIHNKPRKVTGASFIVLNGALKSSSGLIAKSSIVEDGLMIQILPEQMIKLRTSLKNMKDFKINCGVVNVQSDESVSILWTENDVSFNVGVVSPIDNMALSGIPSIRVHNGKDYVCNSGNKLIRWTEVFIIQSGEESTKSQDPVDISKISESISKATSQALVKYLDLLATNSFTKIGVRTTLNIDNVSYSAGSNNTKLPPIYMKSLDNELVPALHKITSSNFGDATVIIELVFHILNM